MLGLLLEPELQHNIAPWGDAARDVHGVAVTVGHWITVDLGQTRLRVSTLEAADARRAPSGSGVEVSFVGNRRAGWKAQEQVIVPRGDELDTDVEVGALSVRVHDHVLERVGDRAGLVTRVIGVRETETRAGR